MLNKGDLENHIAQHRGRLTEEFISKLIGVKKYHIQNIVDRLVKKEIITPNSNIYFRTEKNNLTHEIFEREFELIDAMIILSKYKNQASIESLKLCKELLHA